MGITDAEALQAFRLLCRYEGIIPALESSHALAHALKMAAEATEPINILVNLSGRGDKDVSYVRQLLGDHATLDPATDPLTDIDVLGVLDVLTPQADTR